jgi:hypothetical protein
MVDGSIAQQSRAMKEIGSWMVWVILYRHSDTVSILVVVLPRIDLLTFSDQQRC